MRKYDPASLEADSVQLTNRYTVTVQFVINAESSDDAETEVTSLIQEGVISVLDSEDREPLHEYDIINSEPAEVRI